MVREKGTMKLKEPHTLRSQLICSLIAVILSALVVCSNILFTNPNWIQVGTCAVVFIVALFNSVKSWRQLVQN